ncbi:MAG: hypothetical protein J5950_04910 [Clostridia bacterium]|nr:hypothetical protein [Clostridia bacterium]
MSYNYSSAEETIERVLSGKEFNRGEKRQVNLEWLKEILDKISEFFNKIMRAISEWLDKLFSRLHISFGESGDAKGAKTAAKIIVVVLIIAAIIALTILVIKLLKHGKRKKLAAAEDRELAEYSQNPDAALALAEKYRAEGQTRLSFRYLFINLLTEMNKREIIKIARYKTNRSYLREAQTSSKADMALVKPFFDTFNRVWYGGKALGSGELDRFFENRTAILEKADSAGKAGENQDE